MSSQTHEPAAQPTETVDAVVLAGTRGAPVFAVEDGAPTPKPYLRLGGQTLVARAVGAVLAARGVGRVYVVGDPDALAEALAETMTAHPDRVILVPQGDGLVENGLLAFFHHLLPGRGFALDQPLALDFRSLRDFRQRHPEACVLGALVVTSDLPFIAASDVEEFLAGAPEDATIVAGLVDHAQLEDMQRVLGTEAVLDNWKLGGMPVRGREIRLNNLWLARPLLTDPVIYALAGAMYEHRWLLDRDGRVLWRNWWAILRALGHYSMRLRGRLRFFRGLFNFMAAFASTALARLFGRLGRWAAWPFRLFTPLRDLEFIGSLLYGAPARVVLCESVAPAIDIDVQESYRALSANGGENYRRVARYLGRLPVSNGARADKPDLRVISGGKP